MCGSMVDIQSATAEIRRGKKKWRRRTKQETTGQKYNGLPYSTGRGHKEEIRGKIEETTGWKYNVIKIIGCLVPIVCRDRRYRLISGKYRNKPSAEHIVSMQSGRYGDWPADCWPDKNKLIIPREKPEIKIQKHFRTNNKSVTTDDVNA